MVVNGSEFEKQRPQRVLEKLTRILRDGLGDEAKIDHGNMAVTLEYPDAMTIQLLPAIQTDQGLRIPASGKAGWAEIDPDTFRHALIRRNSDCGGKLVPTIKLAKAVISNLPEKYQLSGYHVESLAVRAFKDYKGEKTTTAMLPYFFEQAKDLVLHPIRDRSGQSRHVDEYLGADDSSVRQEISHLFSGITKRMRTASAAQSQAQWNELFYTE